MTGIISRIGQPQERRLLQAINTTIADRGLHGEGHFEEDAVTLGHHRLAILDLSQLGNQPMQSADGCFIITYNGEVYNYGEVCLELEAMGHGFHFHTDTEVILAACVQWGKSIGFE